MDGTEWDEPIASLLPTSQPQMPAETTNLKAITEAVQFSNWRVDPPKPPQFTTRFKRFPWHGLLKSFFLIGAYI